MGTPSEPRTWPGDTHVARHAEHRPGPGLRHLHILRHPPHSLLRRILLQLQDQEDPRRWVARARDDKTIMVAGDGSDDADRGDLDASARMDTL